MLPTGEYVHSPEVESATKHLLQFFDHNKDGTVSFQEFVLIVIALAVPEKDVDIVFDIIDLDNNGVLTEEEFNQVLGYVTSRKQHHLCCWLLATSRMTSVAASGRWGCSVAALVQHATD